MLKNMSFMNKYTKTVRALIDLEDAEINNDGKIAYNKDQFTKETVKIEDVKKVIGGE